MKRNDLEEMLKNKKTLEEISIITHKSKTSVRYWIKKYGLKDFCSNVGNRTWTHNEMLNAIENSVTISDVLRKLNLKIRPGNYFTINKFIKENDINISHMIGKKIGRGGTKSKRLDEILVSNSFYSRSRMKKRLLENGILKNQCSICGMLPEWQGKPLMLILDHINGCNSDNRIENLRILCPNCNSQQKTFCRNINKERMIPKCKRGVCVDCGQPIVEGAKRCVKCMGISYRKIVRPSKEELEKMISSMTMVAIGKKYGVCGNTIKKWATQYVIKV